jgi:hypothetical protein
VGKENIPVNIIDDFGINTADIINDACTHTQFDGVNNSYYPGIRAQLPKAYVITVLQAVYQLIAKIYKVPIHLQLKPQETYYSLITYQESDLSLVQRMPHFDTSRHYYFAVLHYLNDAPHGNTGLFRHVQTQLDRVEESNVNYYLNAAQQYIDNNGEPPQTYVTDSSEHFELYHEIEYKPNRLVIYPGHLLHSILVNCDTDIDANPATGRLTANTFIEFK